MVGVLKHRADNSFFDFLMIDNDTITNDRGGIELLVEYQTQNQAQIWWGFESQVQQVIFLPAFSVDALVLRCLH